MQPFITEDMSRAEGHALMIESAAAHVNPFVAGPADPSRKVKLDRSTTLFGDVVLTECAYDNYLGRTTAAQAKWDTEYLRISFVGEGHAMEQYDRQVYGRQGSLITTWSLASMSSRIEFPTTTTTLTIPLERIGLPYLLMRDLMGTDLGASRLAGLMSAFTRELLETPELPPDTAAALAGPIIDLVRVTITSAAGDEFLSREPLNATLGTRMRMFLRQQLFEPSLSADTIATKFGISRRAVYSTLRSEGISLGDWVRRERLRSASDWLRAPSHRLLSIGAVAAAAGFADHATFARAFRSEYGCSPTEWRNLG